MPSIRFLSLAVAVLLSASAGAAPAKSKSQIKTSASSTARSVAPAESVETRRSSGRELITLQLIGGSNKISGEMSGAIFEGTGRSGISSSASGFTPINGVAAGAMMKISDYFGWDGEFAILSRNFDESRVNGALPDPSEREKSHVWNARATGMARYFVHPNFSFGAGVFGSHFVGPLRTEVAGRDRNVSFKEAALRRSELGTAFGGRLQLPISPGFDFIADARLLLGLTNLQDEGDVQANIQRELLAGGVDPVRARSVANNTEVKMRTRDFQMSAGVGYRF